MGERSGAARARISYTAAPSAGCALGRALSPRSWPTVAAAWPQDSLLFPELEGRAELELELPADAPRQALLEDARELDSSAAPALWREGFELVPAARALELPKDAPGVPQAAMREAEALCWRHVPGARAVAAFHANRRLSSLPKHRVAHDELG